MPINPFQVGFAIASGDQSRLFLLKVFFSQIMIRWWWCIIVHICDGDDGYDDPGRWERQCKTGSSGKSEGQVANVPCSSFIIRITIITTIIIIIARNVHWHHWNQVWQLLFGDPSDRQRPWTKLRIGDLQCKYSTFFITSYIFAMFSSNLQSL